MARRMGAPWISRLTSSSLGCALGLGLRFSIVARWRRRKRAMAGLAGLYFMYFLKEVRRGYPSIPRILMTAYPDPSLEQVACNDIKVAAILHKPLDASHVLLSEDDGSPSLRNMPRD
jgi:hypothetical protein